MPQILSPDNLRLAFWKAARGHQDRAEVRAYRARSDEELAALEAGLRQGDYPVGRFHRFAIHDPKERIIHAPGFAERVLHHALMNVCEPVFERLAIADTYACRKGKGQWAAVARATQFAAAAPFLLKMDVRKYFDSVLQERLLSLLRGRFKDEAVLGWLERIVAGYHTTPGRGLPIGSLTSQHLANFYLGSLDRFVKETLRHRYYLRHMDDCAIWGASAAELRAAGQTVEAFLHRELGLQLKPTPFSNRCVHGMYFLGCRIHPGWAGLNRRSRRRLGRTLRRYEQYHEAGLWDEARLQSHVEPLFAFARQARSQRFRQRTLQNFGSRRNGLQPREPRRQLEQQRPELPFRQPEQEHADEPEQQLGVPGRPSSGRGRSAATELNPP